MILNASYMPFSQRLRHLGFSLFNICKGSGLTLDVIGTKKIWRLLLHVIHSHLHQLILPVETKIWNASKGGKPNGKSCFFPTSEHNAWQLHLFNNQNSDDINQLIHYYTILCLEDFFGTTIQQRRLLVRLLYNIDIAYSMRGRHSIH